MPDATMEAFLDHGRAALTVTEGVTEAAASLDGVAAAGVSLDEITAQLLADGVKAFADSFDLLMDNIERKRSQLLAAPSPRS